MAPIQRCIFRHENINLHADAIAGMIALDTLESFHKRRKSISHKHHLPFGTAVCCFARQSEDILETCASPVIDDEEREDCGADRIEPPDIELRTNQWKEEG